MSAAEKIDPIPPYVPAELATRPQWLVWRWEPAEGKDKPQKVPYYTDATRRRGEQGSALDRRRLVSADGAWEACQRHGFDGIGFAFLPGDGLIGIDLDDKIDPATGEVDPEALAIIARAGTYCEVSPSGTGFHLIAQGTCETFKDNGIGLEVFCGRQFFTWTGNTGGEPAPVATLPDDLLDELRTRVAQAKAARKPAQPAPPTSSTRTSTPSAGTTHYGRGALDDACTKVARADDGARNDTLNAAAFGIAQLVAGDEIGEGEAWGRLSDAARACGLGDREITKTLRSAFTAGQREPRSAPARQPVEIDITALLNQQGGKRMQNEGTGKPATGARRFRLIHAKDLRARPIEWMIEDYLEASATAIWFGDSQSLKTFTVIDVAMHLAAGRDWQGHRIARAYSVAYICGEGERGIGRRVAGWCQHHGVDQDTLPFFASNMPGNFVDPQRRREMVEALVQDTAAHAPDLVVIDTLARNLGGEENSNDDVNMLFALLDAEVRPLNNCAVILVGHPGHGEKNRPRGAAALIGNSDALVRLERPNMTTMNTVFTPLKMKDAPIPPPITFEAFEVPVSTHAADGTLEEGTTLVIKRAETAPREAGRPTPRAAVLAIKAFFEAGGGEPVHLEAWRECFYRAHTGDTIQAKRQAFHRARGELVDAGAVAVNDDTYSLVPEVSPWGDWLGLISALRLNQGDGA